MLSLRPYQSEALRVSKEKYDAGIRRQLVALPTGTGKTPLFANLPKHHGFDKRTLVLVHREELAKQAIEEISEWNPDYTVGLEMADSSAGHSTDVVVAGVQSIGRTNNTRILSLPPDDFGAIICDEAHHSIASTYRNIFQHFGFGDDDFGTRREDGRLLFGVTATPNRSDGQGLGQVYDEIVYQMSILEAIRQGWLVDIRGIKVSTGVSLDNVHVRAGDFADNELQKAVNIDSRNHLIVQSWLSHGENRQTIAFTVDIAHAKQLADTFKAYGVAAEAIWGVDPHRSEKLQCHKDGTLKVLTNCDVLTEGYNDKSVSCIVMARPTKSSLKFIQMAGRGTRLPKGIDNLVKAREQGIPISKEDCLLIDVVDSTSKHSLVTLPSIFGLPPKLNMKGGFVTKALEDVEKELSKHPTAKLDQIEVIDDIRAQVERAELFEIKWPAEVVENSKFRWLPTISGDYMLTLPKDERVTIYKDLLGKWNVWGRVCGNFFEQCGLTEVKDAFSVADGFIMQFGRALLRLLRREEKWHRHSASTSQMNYLRNLGVSFPENITKGEAHNLIEKTLRERARPIQKAA